VVVLSGFTLAKDLLVPLLLLATNVVVDFIPCSTYKRTNALLILLYGFTSILSRFLVEDIVLAYPTICL
jgi:hypothetical protein